MFYAYDQNNSRGEWHEPAITIVVEARNMEEADAIASKHGVDEDAPFCPCCGRRWSLGYASEYESPKEHWRISEEGSYMRSSRSRGSKTIPLALIVYADGRKEVIP